jgi:DNA modification methylase/predicted RNA-binding Zn-ribbon protein involved in translation (DUF1610 family)
MARRKKKIKPGLLIDSDEQLELMDKSMEQQVIEGGEVECLGMKFPNDDERKKYFLEILREKLKDPEFRKIEGFPIGEDEDILALSDPPYYTACPNPFIDDFIKHYGKPYDPENDNYRREPFAADVSEGKNDPIYNAHSYHTKVPHKAIIRYILHYTEPGDVVYDGFCGTGMTGVAAQLCRDKDTIESLDYKIDNDDLVYESIVNEEGKRVKSYFSKIGARRIIMNDLSPSAVFISYNYNTPPDVQEFKRIPKKYLMEIEAEFGWMYETIHSDNKTKGKINYTIWSDVLLCPNCSNEIIYYDVIVDEKAKKVKNDFSCPKCKIYLTKRKVDKSWTSFYDKILNQTVKQVKQVPVIINYSVGNKRYLKKPDEHDRLLYEKISNLDIRYEIPKLLIPKGDKTGEPIRLGINYIHQMYTKRNVCVLAGFADKCRNNVSRALWLVTAVSEGSSKLNRERPFGLPSKLSGTLYISSMIREINPIDFIGRKFNKYQTKGLGTYAINSTHSTTEQMIPSNSIDYIFTDPPFGGNLMYSELNLLWESWLKLFTNSKDEALENREQNKDLIAYQKLMTDCFKNYYRILKPGRWMTVEFHNSKNSVWNAIQESLQHAGFVIADVRSIDKKQGSFNQVTASGAVKQDLIISAYKPNDGLEKRFQIKAGTEDGAWDFIRTHLKQLPNFVSKDGEMEVIAERQNYLLYDRMVAFHVQRGVSVPISAGDFYKGLAQRFPERDGMYFLPEQVAEYDKKRMSVNKVLQLQLFVNDEASAIQWLKQQLTSKPQTFQDIHPVFMRELGGWQKHEKPLELSDLLSENFLRYDGQGEVPSQIHSYLSSNFKELRNLQKDDPKLKAKAKDRWYVPDPNKAGDLEKLRERSLLKEFEEYRESTQRKLKVFRLEAIRAGFKKAWQEKDYKTIIDIAKKIPDNVLQEDPKLMMWYDQALTRSGEE